MVRIGFPSGLRMLETIAIDRIFPLIVPGFQLRHLS